MIGARAFSAMSCTLMIFCACVSRERAAEHGEVLGEQIDRAAVDRAPAGDHAVAGDFRLLHAEVGGAVLDEHVELLERALVEQQFDALARGQLAALVLGLDARLAAAQAGLVAAAVPACRGCLSWPLPVRVRFPMQKAYHGACRISLRAPRKGRAAGARVCAPLPALAGLGLASPAKPAYEPPA